MHVDNCCLPKEILGSETTSLVISNEEMNDILAQFLHFCFDQCLFLSFLIIPLFFFVNNSSLCPAFILKTILFFILLT